MNDILRESTILAEPLNDSFFVNDQRMAQSIMTHNKTVRPLYSLKNLGKEYKGPSEKVTIIANLNLDIKAGETISIVGASGSGKSTLLHILGTLSVPSWGNIYFNGEEVTHALPERKAILRNEAMGFVFQFHHLLPEFSALENIAMPGIMAGVPREEALEKAYEMLCLVGLKNRSNFNVTLLSGGERQRAAIARAIFRNPMVLLADEPTGNLDEKNGRTIADLMLELNETHKMALIVVTHNLELATRMGRCLELKSGDLYDQTR